MILDGIVAFVVRELTLVSLKKDAKSQQRAEAWRQTRQTKGNNATWQHANCKLQTLLHKAPTVVFAQFTSRTHPARSSIAPLDLGANTGANTPYCTYAT